MLEFGNPLLQWLNANPGFAGLVTFLISATESIAIIGTIIPGSITMSAIGILAGAGVIPLYTTIFWAIMGAIIGDGISYWIGHYFKARLRSIWPFYKHPRLLESGEIFVHKYGIMSVFIGRFVGPVRALVPLVAGMLGMKPLQFTIANIASAIGWAPAYMLPGILLGAAALELPPDIAAHVMLVFLLITLFVLLCLWLLYKLLKLYHTQTNQIQNWIWQKLLRSRSLRPITYLLKHHDTTRSHGQLNLFFYFLLVSLLLCSLIVYVHFYGASTIPINDVAYHLFRGIRHPSLDPIMLQLTLVGQKEVILPIVIVIFTWLIFCKRWRAAIYALALGILTSGSIFIIKHLVQKSRPWGIYSSPETYSMPSGHTALATALIMGIAFLFASSIQRKFRWPIYTTAILLIFAVGISRLYLGAHWFTDVLAGWLLGSAILMLVIISYEHKKEAQINPLALVLIALFSFAVSYGIYHHLYFNQQKINYAMIDRPITKIDMNEWWRENVNLPAYNVSLFGFPSHAINLVWVGHLDQIKTTLMNQEWTNPPARDLISTLHRIADVKSTQYLSLISPQYLDKPPELTLVRKAIGYKGLLVLRLWNSTYVIKETHTPLWVGTLGVIPRSYSWISKSRPGEIEINADEIFPNKNNLNPWEWKILSVDQKQKMMLIRKKSSTDRK